jgi:hypothetical protein
VVAQALTLRVSTVSIPKLAVICIVVNYFERAGYSVACSLGNGVQFLRLVPRARRSSIFSRVLRWWSAALWPRMKATVTASFRCGRNQSVFGDPIIATAILDRLLHHSTTVNIRGESYRLKERRKAGLIPLPEQQQPESPAAALNGRGKRSRSL